MWHVRKEIYKLAWSVYVWCFVYDTFLRASLVEVVSVKPPIRLSSITCQGHYMQTNLLKSPNGLPQDCMQIMPRHTYYETAL